MAAATEDTAAILEKPTAEDLGASSSSSAPQTYNHPGSAGAVEIDHFGDADSAFESEVASYTTSIASSISNYKVQHGRRYHAYKEGSYVMPNDEKESDRLDMTHKLISVAMKDKLFFSPITKPKRVLDIGTGTGVWAMEIGDMFPDADVIGNDLSPIQPKWVPPNVSFEVDDVTDDWTYSKKFDFIHCRTMAGAIEDWPKLIGKCFDFTNPGGYSEFIDWDMWYTSPDGSFKEGGAIYTMNRTYIEGMRKSKNMDPCAGRNFEQWVREAGFEDVQAVKLPLPVGVWPADKHLKEIGAWNSAMVAEGVEGFIYYLFGMLGWSKEEMDVLCARARAELRDPKFHPMFWLHIVYGRKPGAEKDTEPDLNP